MSLQFLTKNKFGEINISDCNFLQSSYGSDPKMCEVCEIYHTVPCDADTLVTDLEIYILCNILQHFIESVSFLL